MQSATAFRQEEEIKGIQIGKEEVHPSLFADDMTVYTENHIGSTKNLLDLLSELGKVVVYNINIQKLTAFLYTSIELSERGTKKKILLTIANNNKVSRNKLNQGGKDLNSENYRTLKKD